MTESETPDTWLPANGTEFELFYASQCAACVWNGDGDAAATCPILDDDGWADGQPAWRTAPIAGGDLFLPRCSMRQECEEGEPRADLEAALNRAARYAALERSRATGRPVIA